MDLERALGQFMLYRVLLERKEPDRALYLAVSEDVYTAVFDVADGRHLVDREQVRILVFDPESEVILRWIK